MMLPGSNWLGAPPAGRQLLTVVAGVPAGTAVLCGSTGSGVTVGSNGKLGCCSFGSGLAGASLGGAAVGLPAGSLAAGGFAADEPVPVEVDGAWSVVFGGVEEPLGDPAVEGAVGLVDGLSVLFGGVVRFVGEGRFDVVLLAGGVTDVGAVLVVGDVVVGAVVVGDVVVTGGVVDGGVGGTVVVAVTVLGASVTVVDSSAVVVESAAAVTELVEVAVSTAVCVDV
jgi:hypothetical protein